MSMPALLRKTTQAPAPAISPPTPAGQYDLYPAFELAPGQIQRGHAL